MNWTPFKQAKCCFSQTSVWMAVNLYCIPWRLRSGTPLCCSWHMKQHAFTESGECVSLTSSKGNWVSSEEDVPKERDTLFHLGSQTVSRYFLGNKFEGLLMYWMSRWSTAQLICSINHNHINFSLDKITIYVHLATYLDHKNTSTPNHRIYISGLLPDFYLLLLYSLR